MRPFNLEHAKAGAPVRLSDGTESVRIICTDRAGQMPVVALVGGSHGETVQLFDAQGHSGHLAAAHLVMKPLGTCQGREVHWGDKLVDAAGTVMVGNDWTQEDFDQCTWPAQYPTTRMHQHDLVGIIQASRKSYPVYLVDLVNAAIKHGIDSGYLFAAPVEPPSDDDLLRVWSSLSWGLKDADTSGIISYHRMIWNLKRGA